MSSYDRFFASQLSTRMSSSIQAAASTELNLYGILHRSPLEFPVLLMVDVSVPCYIRQSAAQSKDGATTTGIVAATANDLYLIPGMLFPILVEGVDSGGLSHIGDGKAGEIGFTVVSRMMDTASGAVP